MVVFETDFLIDLLRGEDHAVDKAREIEDRGERKATTPISATELLEGAYYVGGQHHLIAARDLLQNLEILEFDLEAADRAGEIGAELAREGRPIGIADTMIAGIVKRHGERLITRDDHYREVRGLVVERY
jgi:predicted nucleic acid-binding protein